MQNVSWPSGASAAIMLSIVQRLIGLMLALSSPLAMAMVMKIWFMSLRRQTLSDGTQPAGRVDARIGLKDFFHGIDEIHAEVFV